MKQLHNERMPHISSCQCCVAYRLLGVLLLGLLSIFTMTACKQQAFMAQLPPYLPPQYYACIEVKSGELVNTYFSGYSNTIQAEALYNNQYFVFKDMPVKDWMLVDVDKGWIWVGSGVKCLLVDPGAMDAFELEDRIDVVGFNTGIISHETPGLLFKECYVLPAGAVQLPAAGGGAFSAGY